MRFQVSVLVSLWLIQVSGKDEWSVTGNTGLCCA
jgi:hypothetical protein